MRRTITILFPLLFLITCAVAQEFDPQPLQNEIAGLEQQLKEAKAESVKYTGGLIKTLIDSRIQILEHTKTMLEQRLAAGNYRLKINYTVNGKEYVPVANKDEILKKLESETLRVVQEMELNQKEADQYSGGLIRITKLSIVALNQQQLAMLDMKRCAVIYDIPLFTFEGASPASVGGSTAPSIPVPSEETLAEIDGMFTVKLTGKRVFEANYSDHLGLKLLLTNNTEKDIKAVQGVIIFSDLFDSEILRIRITMEENVPAGQTLKNNDYSIKLNQFNAEHNRLKTIDIKNLKMRFEVHGIIFKDGTVVNR